MTRDRTYALGAHTTESFARVATGDRPLAVLVPVGAVEPHGPHLGLSTDIAISQAVCDRAAPALDRAGVAALVSPAVPFGVTDCARAFAGAISVPADVVTAYLRAVIDGFLAQGASHVCLVNSHLEPAHDQAVRAAAEGRGARAGIASPLERRYARTLSEEFRRGACHAGRYETSIALAAAPELVDDETARALPEVDVSLSDALAAGVRDFADMGLSRAYAGAPARATTEEGVALLRKLADMVVTQVREALERPPDRG